MSSSGSNAPALIEILGFSTKNAGFTLFIVPKPLQCGQLPFGELKEKVFGSGSATDCPVSSSIRFLEKYSIFSFPIFCIPIMPSPSSKAVSNDFSIRPSVLVSPIIHLSIMMSISWVLYLSSFRSYSISIISPSTRA